MAISSRSSVLAFSQEFFYPVYAGCEYLNSRHGGISLAQTSKYGTLLVQ